MRVRELGHQNLATHLHRRLELVLGLFGFGLLCLLVIQLHTTLLLFMPLRLKRSLDELDTLKNTNNKWYYKHTIRATKTIYKSEAGTEDARKLCHLLRRLH